MFFVIWWIGDDNVEEPALHPIGGGLPVMDDGAPVPHTRQTFLGVKSRLRRIEALAEAVRAGENALLAKEESFAAGLTTNIAVLDAQRDLFRAERDYLKERYDYIRQMLELEELSGNLDEEDVRRVNALLTEVN